MHQKSYKQSSTTRRSTTRVPDSQQLTPSRVRSQDLISSSPIIIEESTNVGSSYGTTRLPESQRLTPFHLRNLGSACAKPIVVVDGSTTEDDSDIGTEDTHVRSSSVAAYNNRLPILVFMDKRRNEAARLAVAGGVREADKPATADRVGGVGELATVDRVQEVGEPAIADGVGEVGEPAIADGVGKAIDTAVAGGVGEVVDPGIADQVGKAGAADITGEAGNLAIAGGVGESGNLVIADGEVDGLPDEQEMNENMPEVHEKGTQTEPVPERFGEGMSVVQVLRGTGNLGINIQVGSGQLNHLYINIPSTPARKRKLDDEAQGELEDKEDQKKGKKRAGI